MGTPVQKQTMQAQMIMLLMQNQTYINDRLLCRLSFDTMSHISVGSDVCVPIRPGFTVFLPVKELEPKRAAPFGGSLFHRTSCS